MEGNQDSAGAEKKEKLFFQRGCDRVWGGGDNYRKQE